MKNQYVLSFLIIVFIHFGLWSDFLKKNKYNDFIVEIRKPSEEEKKEAQTWKIWNKEVSSFDMAYQKNEYCLILEGEVEIVTRNNRYFFKAGDYVKFPKGLKCKWIIKKDVKKHYKFS